MMSYKVVKNCSDTYDLFEKDSNITIQVDSMNENEIRAVCRKLNLGSGFCGWTPAFVAKKLFTFTGR